MLHKNAFNGKFMLLLTIKYTLVFT